MPSPLYFTQVSSNLGLEISKNQKRHFNKNKEMETFFSILFSLFFSAYEERIFGIELRGSSCDPFEFGGFGFCPAC